MFASQKTNPRPVMYKLPPPTPGYDFIVYDFVVGLGICFLWVEGRSSFYSSNWSRSHSVAQAGLKSTAILHQITEFWDSRPVSL